MHSLFLFSLGILLASVVGAAPARPSPTSEVWTDPVGESSPINTVAAAPAHVNQEQPTTLYLATPTNHAVRDGRLEDSGLYKYITGIVNDGKIDQNEKNDLVFTLAGLKEFFEKFGKTHSSSPNTKRDDRPEDSELYKTIMDVTDGKLDKEAKNDLLTIITGAQEFIEKNLKTDGHSTNTKRDSGPEDSELYKTIMDVTNGKLDQSEKNDLLATIAIAKEFIENNLKIDGHSTNSKRDNDPDDRWDDNEGPIAFGRFGGGHKKRDIDPVKVIDALKNTPPIEPGFNQPVSPMQALKMDIVNAQHEGVMKLIEEQNGAEDAAMGESAAEPKDDDDDTDRWSHDDFPPRNIPRL